MDEIMNQAIEVMARGIESQLYYGTSYEEMADAALRAVLDHEFTRTCQVCRGTGHLSPRSGTTSPNDYRRLCPTCNGSGSVPSGVRLGFMEQVDAFERFIAGDGQPALRVREEPLFRLVVGDTP